jgi:Family of unknown function (DUF6281)
MRRALACATATVAMIVFGACEARDDRHPTGTASAACPAVLQWQGALYDGTGTKGALSPGPPLPTAVRPVCADTGVSPARAGKARVAVARVRGVSPEIALVERGNPIALYLARGYLPQLPSHPLHARLYGRGKPSLPAPGRCAPQRRAVTGTLQVTGVPGLFAIPSRGADVEVVVVETTRVDGTRKNGLPYLESGNRVTIAGVDCQPTGERERLYAHRIDVLP